MAFFRGRIDMRERNEPPKSTNLMAKTQQQNSYVKDATEKNPQSANIITVIIEFTKFGIVSPYYHY